MEQCIKEAGTISKKSTILNNRIHCEMFYYNPIYGKLLSIRNYLLE